jgi:hypothetical protein
MPTSIERWSPFRDLANNFERMERYFDQFVAPAGFTLGHDGKFGLEVDLKETERAMSCRLR